MNIGDIYLIVGLSIVTLFFGVMAIAMFDYEKKQRNNKSH